MAVSATAWSGPNISASSHPESIAAWTRANIESLDPDLILFVRRPAYQQRDPIGNFIDAVRSVVQAADTRPVGVVLPPLSSFDLATGFVTDPVSPADQAVGMIQIGLGSTPVLDVQAAYLTAQQALGSGLLRKWVRLERTPSSQTPSRPFDSTSFKLNRGGVWDQVSHDGMSMWGCGHEPCVK